MEEFKQFTDCGFSMPCAGGGVHNDQSSTSRIPEFLSSSESLIYVKHTYYLDQLFSLLMGCVLVKQFECDFFDLRFWHIFGIF